MLVPTGPAYPPAVPAWDVLANMLLLLGGGFVLGALAERFKQSAILGYLAAGMLLGPHALNWVANPDDVELLAELGVALLLFSIGLEFPWSRLKRSGGALAAGGLQVLLTLAAGAGLALLFGLGGVQAFTVGAILALSSTAYVLRLLTRHAALESPRGRLSIGVLLAQDVAVVPLVLVVSVLMEGKAVGPALLSLARLVGLALLLVIAFRVLFHWAAPRLLGTEVLRTNRELPLLLAVTSGIGSALAAHTIGISPAIGAFLAGMLLADSPFALQVRADIGALRTILMTLFFGSIGMLGNPAWIAAHLPTVLAFVGGAIVLKAFLATAALRVVGSPSGPALAAGIGLAQIGEFSFVLAEMSRGTILDGETLQLVVSVTIATLALTPYLMVWGPKLAARLVGRAGAPPEDATGGPAHGHVIVVGYGPTGEAVGRRLERAGLEVHVVDLNPRLVERARAHGLHAHLGDATHPDVLEHLSVATALAVAVTVPDPTAARRAVEQVRALASSARVFARARYHLHRNALAQAGAEVVVDEESLMGRELADVLAGALGGGTAQANLQGRLPRT